MAAGRPRLLAPGGEPRPRSALPALLASVLACGARAAGDSSVWRLLCNSSTVKEWHVCDTGFFVDSACTATPSPRLDNFVYSPYRTATPGVSADRFLVEYASACSTCEAGAAYFGAVFASSVAVRCARYQQCVVTSTSTRTTTTITTMLAPSPAPSPSPSPAPSLSPVPSPSPAPSPSPSPPPGPPPETTTTTNPFLNLGWPSRRLEPSRSCHSVLLQRSPNGIHWSSVAEWQDPAPGDALSLASAAWRPLNLGVPLLSAWAPGTQSCSYCGGAGLGPRDSLKASFDGEVFPGSGSFRLERGGATDIVIAARDKAWVIFSGSRLLISPQADLGVSGGCSKIFFDNCPIVSADGYCSADLGGYSFCIADTRAPVLQSSDPLQGGVCASLRLEARFAFDEEVRVATTAAAARLVAVQSSDSAWPSTYDVDLKSSQVSLGVFNAGTGAMELEIVTDQVLPAESVFQLEMPGGAVLDRAGHAWGGTRLVFTTPCAPAGCVTKTRTTTAGPPVSAAEGEASVPIGLIVGIIAAVLCCGGAILYGWRLYVKSVLHGDKWDEESSSTAKVAPAQAGNYVQSSPTAATAARGGTSSIPLGEGLRRAAQAWEEPATSPVAKSRSDEAPQGRGFRRQKSKEAEDLDPRGRRAGKPPPGGGRAAATAESCSAGGWVQQVDAASGRPYWMHFKTRETRWDPPPKATGAKLNSPPGRTSEKAGTPTDAAGSAAQEPRQEPPREQPRQPPPAQQPPTIVEVLDPEFARVKEEVEQQFQKTLKEDLASRKKTFKFLCLKWHPDKNQDNSAELATQVFQHLQTQKDWYLKEKH